MKTKSESYASAMNRLKSIVEEIESNKLDIDQLSVKLKEAQAIIAFCKDKLYNTDKEIEKILADKEEM